MRSFRNKKGGTNTVELGPALFIILIIVLIPCLDLMHISLAYACGWYANHLATREAACAGPGKALAAANGATLAWSQSGLGKFVNAPAPTNTVNDDFPPDIDGDGRNDYVQCVTVVKVEPMFKLPFVANQTVTFSYSATRPLEEKNLH